MTDDLFKPSAHDPRVLYLDHVVQTEYREYTVGWYFRDECGDLVSPCNTEQEALRSCANHWLFVHTGVFIEEEEIP